MNYKVLPLFAILILMIIPVSNVDATISGTSVVIDANGSEDPISIGIGDFRQTPTGVIGTDNGFFVAYLSKPFDTTIFFSNSTDGVTYSTPLNVTSTLDGFGYQILNLHIFEDSGIVDMLWQEFDGGGGAPADIKHVRSVNGGTSFGSVNTVVSTANGFGQAESMWFTVSGNNIGVFYENGDNSDLEFTKSANGGTSFSTPVTVEDFSTGSGDSPFANPRNLQLETNVATTIYWVMYSANEFTGGDFDVYSQYSNDGGASWTTPINLSTVQGTTAGTNFQNHLFISGTNVTAVYSGFGGGGQTYLSLARSTNSGVTFNAQQDIELGIVCNWASVGSSHVVAQDKTNLSTIHAICRGDGNVDMMKSKSTDSGATWSTFTSIASDPTDVTQTPVIVQANNGLVTYFWQGVDVFVQQYYRTSEDGGSTLNAEEVIAETVNGQFSFVNVVIAGFDVFIAGINQNPSLIGLFESFAPPDAVPPVVTLVGSSPVFVVQDTVYNELGATCLDDVDGQIDGNVVIGGDVVDESTVAVYTVDYDCQDSASNPAVTVQRTVNVIDDTDIPTITLLGLNPQTMLVNTSYSESGATCIDPSEGDITGSVIITLDGLTTSVVSANNIVEYDCQDSVGNNAVKVERQIIVQKQSQGISSGTTSGQSQGVGGTTEVQTLDDVPTTTQTPQGDPTTVQPLSFAGGNGDGQGISLADFFANLFGQRLDAQTGETVSQGDIGQGISDAVSGIAGGQPSTTGQPTNTGLSIVNAIQNFFSNLFN